MYGPKVDGLMEANGNLLDFVLLYATIGTRLEIGTAHRHRFTVRRLSSLTWYSSSRTPRANSSSPTMDSCPKPARSQPETSPKTTDFHTVLGSEHYHDFASSRSCRVCYTVCTLLKLYRLLPLGESPALRLCGFVQKDARQNCN